MLEIKNNGKELKNNFDVVINKLYMAKERISESEDLSIETSQTEKKNNEKKKTENFEDQQDNSKGVIHTLEECWKEKRRQKKRCNHDVIMAENFPKLMKLANKKIDT